MKLRSTRHGRQCHPQAAKADEQAAQCNAHDKQDADKKPGVGELVETAPTAADVKSVAPDRPGPVLDRNENM